jgi:3-oxoacyl-[acyl-carrier protein] reductase
MDVSFISGSSRGLGKAIADFLRDSGQQVITNSRHPIAGDVYQKDHFVFDCRNRDEVRKALLDLSQTYDIKNLVCVVGSGSMRDDDPDLRWKNNLETNLYSAVILFEETLKIFSGLRNVIFISSIAGALTMKEPPIEYSVAKAALNHYAKLLALIYAPEGILINVVSPGNLLFEGSVWDKRLSVDPNGTMSYIKEKVPLGNFIELDSISSIVQFLLENNQNITGQIISVDGGQSL